MKKSQLKEKRNKNDKNAGITLIALVITIIILLILATVSVQILTGENGLLTKTETAKEKNDEGKELELIKLAVSSAQVKGSGIITMDNLNNELQTYKLNGSLNDNGKNWMYQGEKNSYIIKSTGDVSILEKFKGIIYGNEKKILDDEYQQVKYLKSTGVQYIDTEYVYKISPKIESYYSLDTQQDLDVFGVDSASSTCFIVDFGVYNTLYYRYGSSSYTQVHGVSRANSGFFKWSFSKDVFCNDKLILSGSGNFNFASNSKSLYLFRGRSYAIASIGKTKIYDNDILVRDFIPALDKNGVPCMYDNITKKSYYNKGTGNDFLYGLKEYNCVGDENYNRKFDIQITIKTTEGEQEIVITLDEPLRKLGDKADYLDLTNKKIVRYIYQDDVTGDLTLLDSPTENSIRILEKDSDEEINNIDLNAIISIKVNTETEPSTIE